MFLSYIAFWSFGLQSSLRKVLPRRKWIILWDLNIRHCTVNCTVNVWEIYTHFGLFLLDTCGLSLLLWLRQAVIVSNFLLKILLILLPWYPFSMLFYLVKSSLLVIIEKAETRRKQHFPCNLFDCESCSVEF